MASRSSSRTVFVISSLQSQTWEDIYTLAIMPACHEVGARCIRVDGLSYSGSVLQEVYSYIANADLVIAIVSDASATVWLELGYAHALGKSTLLVAQDMSELPLDTSVFPVLLHGGSMLRLRHELSRVLPSLLRPPVPDPYPPHGGLPSSEEGTYAVVFGDIVGSTSMALKLGELDSRQHVMRYVERVESLAYEHTAVSFKNLGDSFITAFPGAPNALSFAIAARNAGHCQSSSQPPITLRLAVHMAYLDIRRTPYGDDLSGEGIALLSRIEAEVQPGEIGLTPEAVHALGEQVQDHPGTTRRIRPKSAMPVDLYVIADTNGGLVDEA